jgi:CheY-like chemotaxis protein
MAEEPAQKMQPHAAPSHRQADAVTPFDGATQQSQPQLDQTQAMPHSSSYPFDNCSADADAGSATAVAPDPLGSSSAHDVLIVEDDPEINELIGAYVELAGYPCRRCSRGSEAIAAAHDSPPSLVVLDVMLPDLDGFEICRRLRADPRTHSVPIVMLTALDQEDMRRRAVQCGATEYMTKPFDPERLLNTIQNRMNPH